MEVRKSHPRTRRVINYAAMNGDRSSDESDNDFVVNTKISKPSAPSSKPPKLSKLKLGPRKETKLPKFDHTNIAEVVKPISDQTAIAKVIHSPIAASPKIIEEMDFSMAEPDLMTHSIFSQETVITSSCGCLSSHEMSDSSDSETLGTTFELPAARKTIQPKKIVNEDEDFKPLIIKEDKIAKRGINNEIGLNKNKKIKIESKEKQNTVFLSDEFISNVTVDDSDNTSLPSLPVRLSPCLEMVERLISPEKHVPHCQNQNVMLNDDSEIPIVVQDDIIYSSVKQKLNAPKDNHNFEEAEEGPRISSAIHHIYVASNNRPGIESSIEAVSTSKTAKRAMRNETKRNLQKGKKAETKLKVENGLLNNDDLSGSELLPSKNIQTIQPPLHIFKPPSPPLKKVAGKWKPPGKAGGGDANTFLNGNSPTTGIRLGLSRNRRANKPLHPDVKMKI